MADLEFKPKQSDCQGPALKHYTILPRLRIDINKNQHDHCKWSDKYTPMRGASTGKRKAKEEARNRS